MKKYLISLVFIMILSVILSCYSLGASSPQPTTNKGAVCSQICHFGDVYVPVDGRDQVDGIQGMAIAGNQLYTAVTRKGYRLQDGSRPSLYTTLTRTDLKTMEQKTIVTDYYDDPNRIGIGHANDMTAVTDTVNGTTYTYVLVTRYIRSATLLRITSDGVIDKTAVIVWKGATNDMQEEIASDRMGTSGLAFTSVNKGIARLLIANKNKFYNAEINLRDMTLCGYLQEAFTVSEEDISGQIQEHFGAYGQKYDEGKGSGWGYQGISYARNTNKIFLPITVTKDVNNTHEYRAAVLVYDKNGNLLPSEGFAFNETSMEIEGIDFYGSYLYWDAICYDPIASDGIPEGNRVFRMWTKANFTFDKTTDADSWSYNKNRISDVSVSDSLLSFTPAKVTDGGSPWIRRELNFSFPQADMFKIKFRIVNCDGIDGGMPKIRFHVSQDAKNWTSVSATATTVGDWYVAAVAIPNTMKEVNVKYLEVMFDGINGKDSTSRIYVDYIYAGPEWVVPDGHSYVYKATKKPTTSATGTLTGTCSACGAITTISLPKLNTTDYTKTITKAPTCTQKGTDSYRWNTTTYGTFTFTATTDALGHRYEAEVVTEATCTETGLSVYSCTCGDSYTQTLATLPHETTYVPMIPPTCTGEGQKEHYLCAGCGGIFADEAGEYPLPQWYLCITSFGHLCQHIVTEPTCTTRGFTTYICACGEDYVSDEVEAPGHTEVILKAVDATCTTDGLTEGKHCSVCNTVLVKQETVQALGHSYTYTAIDRECHMADCENCDAMEKTAHSFVEGTCACGVKEITEPVELSTLKLGHTLNLASDISVNFVILKQNLRGFDPDSVYAECVLDTYEGNVKTGTRTIRLEPMDKGIHYYFTLTGLTAIQMNDTIVTTLYGTKDGQVYVSPIDTYSVGTYAYSQMNNPDRAESLKVLCADLLRYGSAAQSFKSYRLDSTVDAAMTDAHRAYLSDVETVTFGNTNRILGDLSEPGITWAGKSLSLESKVALKFVFNPVAFKGDITTLTLRISYTDAYGNVKTAIASDPMLYNEPLGYYVFTVDSLLAAELRAVVSAQIYQGDTPVSETLQYSPDTYGNGKSGTLLELCKALFAYSDSAKNYFSGESY